MTTADQIRQCRTPQEALLVLATAVDELRARLDAEPVDPWQQPLEWDAQYEAHPPTDPAPQEIGEPATRALIDAVETALANETDADERRALEARLRVLKDTGSAPEAADQGRRTVEAEFTPGNLRPTQAIQVGGNSVDLPMPTPEQQVARAEWASSRKLWEFIPLETSTCVEAFAKGGPMWLYLGNRPAVMAMPFEYRQELVRMIAEDSVPQSQEVGRDILKQTQSADRQVTIEAVTGA